MANRLWPADAISGTPAYSGRALRQTQSPFLAGATAARPLGARSGVRPGTSTTTVTVSTTTWSCAPHAGVFDVETAAEAGPYTYAVDSTVAGAITASNASNPRVDIVYAQMTDAAEDGAAPGAPAVAVIGYLAGTAAATPTAPAAPARSFVLAQINVPRTGGGSPTATWVAPYSAASGGVISFATRAQLDAAAPGSGTLGHVVMTGQLFSYQPGSTPAWQHLAGAPDTGNYVGVSYWSSSSTRPARALAQAGRVFLEGAVTSQSVTFAAGTEYATGTIPAAFAPKTVKMLAAPMNGALAIVVVYPDGTVSFRPNVGFTGVLDLSLDGLSWADKRVA